MTAQDLLGLLRSRPFVPFRLHATGGRTYEVRYPDQALVLRSRVLLPQPTEGEELPQTSEHLALIHIVRAERLTQAAPVGTNG